MILDHGFSSSVFFPKTQQGGSRDKAQPTPYSCATTPLSLDMLYYQNTLILLVWRDAQHPEIFAYILISDKTMIDLT